MRARASHASHGLPVPNTLPGATATTGAAAGAGLRRASARRLQRLTAFAVDALLAFSAALAWRLAARAGLGPAWGLWAEPTPWVDAQVAAVTLVLASLRDVPTGASVAKWLLCMRLVDRFGARPSWRARLLRAPFSLLPFAWLWPAVQDRLPWRVAAYVPSPRGLAARTLAATAAAVASIAWGVETLRPSIGERHAERLIASTLMDDPILQRELGAPLAFRILRISPRAHEIQRGRLAKFQLLALGRDRQQDMIVVARKIDGDWVIDEIVDIEISTLPAAERGPVATR